MKVEVWEEGFFLFSGVTFGKVIYCNLCTHMLMSGAGHCQQVQNYMFVTHPRPSQALTY